MISLQKQLLRTECREAQNSTPAITSTGFNWSTLRMTLLSCIIIQILWAFSAKGQAPACEEPPAIDFAGIVSDDKLEYRKGDKVQYKCNPGYSLMGTEWITCSGKTWTPAPQCLETGKNCSRPPTIENGDITTFLEKGYTSGSFVEFKCQLFYAMEGQNRSFCDNGNWTKAPLCLEPCAISVEEMENQKVELNGRPNENISQRVYLKRGDFLELRCKPGYELATNLSQSTFTVQCNGNPIVYPECKAPCSLTKQQLETKNLLLSNRRRHAQLIQSEHTLEFMCREGYILTIPSVRKCVNGHMDLPSCISVKNRKNCSRPPTIENGDITTFLEKGYTSGSFVEFKCQLFYAMEGQNRSFCDNGNWTKAPLCLEPCAISVEEMENQKVELNGRPNENISQRVYLKRGDFLELRCKPGYELATNLSQSTFTVQCNGNPIVYPECKAPCSLTKQQLETKNLLLSNRRRHAQLIQSEHTLEFMCREGYILTIPSVRKCVNGHMDLPSCISETGKNCSRPPTIENGDITTFLEKGYTSGSFVEFKCQLFYAMEGQNRSFCDNGNWTKAPLCLEPCAISVEEMENQKVELNGRPNENIS
ncbi:coagulation factor XIII B chain-like [Mauremys reevesii]|uniref:coagulation factor XIII B chain-like n=1 Tax=Mauremys reevesii TaxID=260615 RepID=UPI00193EC337|nr:coagulation factor XIII B chain-like [Mauremys reevesii]